MIDKKKLTIILTVIGVCTIALTIAIIWAVNTLSSRDAETPETDPTTPAAIETTPPSGKPTTSATPAASATPGPSVGTPLLADNLKKKAEKAAQVAATWSGRRERSGLETKYLGAGFTEELASTYESIWATVYDSPVVAKLSDGRIKAGTFASVVSSEVRDIRVEGDDRLFVVAVTIEYDAQWTDSEDIQHIPYADSASKGEATWGVVISEKTGEIVQIDDPTVDLLYTPALSE